MMRHEAATVALAKRCDGCYRWREWGLAPRSSLGQLIIVGEPGAGPGGRDALVAGICAVGVRQPLDTLDELAGRACLVPAGLICGNSSDMAGASHKPLAPPFVGRPAVIMSTVPPQPHCSWWNRGNERQQQQR